MSCKIEHVLAPNGKPSKLFSQLVDAYGAEQGLENYLDIISSKEAFTKLSGVNEQGEPKYKVGVDTKFKLTEFSTPMEQETVVNMLSTMIVSAIKNIPGVADNSTISGMNINVLKNTTNIQGTILKGVRTHIDKILTEHGSKLSDKNKELLKLASKNLPSYLIKNSRLGIVGRELGNYGVHIMPKKNTNSLEAIDQANDSESSTDFEVQSITTERIYDLDITESSFLNSLSEATRAYLKGKFETASVVKGKINYEFTDLHTPKAVNFEKLVSALASTFDGIQSIEDILPRLEKKVKTHPIIAPVYMDVLKEASLGGAKIKTREGTIDYRPISVALYNTFSKSDYNMITVVKTLDNNVLVLPANRGNARNTSKSEAANTIKKIQELPTKSKEAIVTKLEKSAKTLTSVLDTKSLRTTQITQMVKDFKLAGWNVSKDIIKSIEKEIKETPPTKLLDKIKKPKFSQVMSSIYNNVLIKPIATGQDIFSYGKKNFGETKLINFLSDHIGRFTAESNTGAFRANSGKTVHPYNKSSESMDVFKRLIKSPKELEVFSADPMYANSLLLKELADRTDPHSMTQYTYYSMSDSSKYNGGKQFKNQISFESSISKLLGFNTSPTGKGFHYAMSPTFADRGSATALAVPTINSKDGVSDKVVQMLDGKMSIVSTEISDWIQNQVEGELSRIIKAKDLRTTYKNYNDKEGNAFKMMLFPELNELLPDNLTKRNKATTLLQMLPKAEEAFIASLASDISYMKEIGVLTTEGFNKNYPTTKLAQKWLPKELKTLSSEKLHNFLANNFIYTYEQVLFYSGDPAFYKKGDVKNKIDINKRLGLPTTPGDKLAVGQGTGMPETYKLKVVQEPTHRSDSAEMIQELFESTIYKKPSDKNKLFTQSELADGATYSSLKRYKQILMATGEHTREIIEYIEALEAWTPESKTIPTLPDGVYLPILKSFDFRLETRDNIVAPISQKTSLMPVIPHYFEQQVNGQDKFPGMAKLSREFREGRADEISIISAVKVGASKIATLDNIQDVEASVLSNDSYRFPQKATTKESITTPHGSQLRKLITTIKDYGTVRLFGDKMTEREALTKTEDALKFILTKGGDEALTQFLNENGQVNVQNLVESILDSADSSSTTKNVELLQEALSFQEDGTLMLPLNYPTITPEVASNINAMFRSATNRFKVDGYQAVQVSSMGMQASNSKKEISVGSDLKFVEFTDLDGVPYSKEEQIELAKQVREGVDLSEKVKVKPAEVRVTPKYFKNRLKEIAAEKVDRKAFDAMEKSVIATIKKTNPKLTKYELNFQWKEVKNSLIQDAIKKEYTRSLTLISEGGKFSVERIKSKAPELLDIVLYRIPTQAKSSMLAATIIDFLPTDYSSTVQVPGEIVEQSGSDFDIDKVYLLFKGFTVKNNKLTPNTRETNKDIGSVQEAKDTIFEFQKAILTSPNHIQDLLLPTAAVQLEKIVEDFGISDDVFAGALPSLKLQETFKENNKAGKELIGITSISSTAHAIAAHIGVTTDSKISINKRDIELGREYDYDNQHKIADILKELQNAALDNANDPILGKLNVNSTTAGTVLFLISAGHSVEYALNIVNAPIVKDFVRMVEMEEIDLPSNLAQKKVTRLLKSKYKGQGKTPKVNLNTYDLNKATAARLADSTNRAMFNLEQREALGVFLELKKFGDALGMFQNTMNFDSSGTPSTSNELRVKYSKIQKVPGTVANRISPTKAKVKKGQVVFKVTPEKYDAHSLSSFEENSIHKPLKVNRKISIGASSVGAKLSKTFSDVFGYITREQEMHLLSEFNTFLVHSSNSYDNASTGLSKMIEDGKHLEWIDKNNTTSAGNQIMQFKRRAQERGIKNDFINELYIEEEGNNHYVVFNNTKAKAMTPTTKAHLMNEFEELMVSKDPLDRLLAETLANYAAVYYGFALTKNTYMNFLPPSAHTNYMGAKEGMSVPDFFKEIEDKMNDTTLFNKVNEAYLDLYVVNNSNKFLNYVSESELIGMEVDDLPPYILRKSGNSSKVMKLHKGEYINISKDRLNPTYSKVYSNVTNPIKEAKAKDTTDNKVAVMEMSSAIKEYADFTQRILDKVPDTVEGIEAAGIEFSNVITEEMESLNLTGVNKAVINDLTYIIPLLHRNVGRKLKTTPKGSAKDIFVSMWKKASKDLISSKAVQILAEKIKKCN